MRSLQAFEIDYVAGGKTTDPPKSWWEKVWDWINGNSEKPSSAITITGAELGQLQRDCLNAGGSVSISQTTGEASASFRVVGTDGSASYFEYKCAQ